MKKRLSSLKKIVDVIADGAYTKSMIARMKELEEELESLEISSNEQKKRLINTFVSKAFIYKNGKLVLLFNYKKDGEIASYSEILEHISTKSPVLQIPFGGGEGNRTPVQKPSHIKHLQFILSNRFK